MAQGGKTGFEDFYDYQKSKQIIDQIERDVQSLERSFSRFSGFLQGYGKRFKKSLDDTTKSMVANNKAIKALDKSQVEAVDAIVKYTQANEKLNKEGRETQKTYKTVNEVVNQFSKSVNGQKELIKQLTAEFNKLDPTVAKDTQRLQQLSRELIKAREHVREMSKATRDSNNVLRRAEGSYNALTAAIKKDLDVLKNIPGATDKTTAAYKRNQKQIETLQARIRQNTAALTAFDRQIGRSFRNVGNYTSALGQLGGFAKNLSSALGFTGGAFLLAQGIRSAIDFNLELSDALAGVQKTTQLTTDEVRGLSRELSQLPTRTNLIDLLGIAKGAGRIRVANDELVDFVSTVDMLVVSLRDDLEGTTDEIATTIGRIATLFGERDEFGISKGIERIGSGINELAQKTLAGADEIVDFTNRVAGIANVAGFSSDQILALGAAFDEFGAGAEVSATAFQRFIISVGQDTERFAAMVGRSQQEFSQLLKDDPQEAFLEILDAVNSSSDGIEQLAKALGLADVDEQRAIRAFSVLAVNVNRYREILDESNKAVEESNSLAKENAIRQETSAAAVERLTNELKALSAEGSVVDESVKGISNRLATVIGLLRGDQGSKFLASLVVKPQTILSLIAYAGKFEELIKARDEYLEGQQLAKKTLEESEAQRLYNIALESGRKTFLEFLNMEPERLVDSMANKFTVLSLVQSKYNDIQDASTVATEKFKEAQEAGIKTFDEFVGVYEDSIKEMKDSEQILNAIRRLFASLGTVQIGIIQKLNTELDALEAKRKAATSLTEVAKIDLEIKKRREQLRIIDLVGDGYEEAAKAAKEFLDEQKDVTDEEFDALFGDLDIGPITGFNENLRLMTEYFEEITNSDFGEWLEQQLKAPQSEVDKLISKLDQVNAVLSESGNIIDSVGSIFANFSEARVQDQEVLLNAVKERYEEELRLAGDNKAAQDAIRQRQKSEEEKIQREILKERQKAARIDKAFRIFQIASETAQRIFEIKIRALALSIINPGAAAFASSVLIPLAIGSGIAATAAVASEPIPQFAEGTENAPGGPVIINDRKRGSGVARELITTPQKKQFYFDTDKPVLTDMIPKGSRIDPRDISELTNVSDLIKDYSPITGSHRNMMQSFAAKSEEHRKFVTVNNHNSIDYDKLGKAIVSNLPEIHQTIFEEGGKLRKVSVKGNTKRVTGRMDLLKGSDLQKEVERIVKKLK